MIGRDTGKTATRQRTPFFVTQLFATPRPSFLACKIETIQSWDRCCKTTFANPACARFKKQTKTKLGSSCLVLPLLSFKKFEVMSFSNSEPAWMQPGEDIPPALLGQLVNYLNRCYSISRYGLPAGSP
eukprot:g80925.t1